MILRSLVLTATLACGFGCNLGSSRKPEPAPNLEFRADLNKLLAMWRLPTIREWPKAKLPERGEWSGRLAWDRTSLTASLTTANMMWNIYIHGAIGKPLLDAQDIHEQQFEPLKRIHKYLSNCRIVRHSVDSVGDPPPVPTTHISFWDEQNRLVGFVTIKESGRIGNLYWPRNLRSPHLKQIRP